jgi:hypothetical protein
VLDPLTSQRDGAAKQAQLICCLPSVVHLAGQCILSVALTSAAERGPERGPSSAIPQWHARAIPSLNRGLCVGCCLGQAREEEG